jgi:hypothetical protein
MGAPKTAVMLAGTLRPLPLRAAMDVPVLCLPIGERGAVIDAWIDALNTVPDLADVFVVMNTEDDHRVVSEHVRQSMRTRDVTWTMHAIAEPASWRGTAGILHDVTVTLGGDPDDTVLVIEAHTLPPNTLYPTVSAFEVAQTEHLAGVVGVCGLDEPAGVAAFTKHAICQMPPIGYHDIKEQFLPALYEQSMRVRTAWQGERAYRLRTREEYIDAVRVSRIDERTMQTTPRIADGLTFPDSITIDGCSIIEEGVTLEADVVVHDSVVLPGAHIEEGAVVSRSVIGHGIRVPAKQRVVREIIARGSLDMEPATFPNKRRGRSVRKTNTVQGAVGTR